MKKFLSFKQKISLCIYPLVAIFTIILLIFFHYACDIILDQQLWTKLDASIHLSEKLIDSVYPGEYTLTDNGILLKGETPVNEISILNDLKADSDCDFTLFQGSQRVQTTLNTSLLGTTAANEVLQTVLNENRPYHNILQIGTETYYSQYLPLCDKNNKPIGILFAGINYTPYQISTRNNTITFVLISLAILMVICFIIASIVNRTIRHALAVTSLSEEVSSKSSEVLSASQDVHEVALNITNTIEEVAKGATEQAEDMMSVLKVFSDFDALLQSAYIKLKEVNDKTVLISTLASNSHGQMNVATDCIEKVEASFKEYCTALQSFSNNLNRISKITLEIKFYR